MVKHRFGKKALSLLMAICLLASVFSLPTVVTAVTTQEQPSQSLADDYGLKDNVQDGVILHCWNWSFNNIKEQMKTIAECGYTSIQTSPIQIAKQDTKGASVSDWWVLYQPAGFVIDDTGGSALGTKAEFKAMCDEAHKYGIHVIVDVIANHLGNVTQGNTTLCQRAYTYEPTIANNWLFHTDNMGTDDNNGYSVVRGHIGMPDLQTENQHVQDRFKAFLRECIDNGADGFRVDTAKHIETPDDGSFGSDFWPEVTDDAYSYYAQKGTFDDLYIYGEILNSPGAGRSYSSYTKYINITDNKTGNDCRSNVANGNASGAAAPSYQTGEDPSKVVLWAESHDTYSNDSRESTNVSESNINKTWALVGTRNKATALYFARSKGFKTGTMGSIESWQWKSDEVVAVNKFHNYFAGQSEYLASSGSIAYNERGTSGVVLVNCSGGSTSVNVKANRMADGTYTDQITGNTFTVSGGQISGQIGSTGIAVVYNAITTPSVTVSKDSGTYRAYQEDGISVDLSLRNATSGTYSINGGAAQTFTGDTTISVGEGVDYGVEITLTVTATDDTTTSDPETYIYKKFNPDLAQKVYFDNSSYNWSQVYCYMYTDGGSTGGGGSSGGGSTGGGSTGGGSSDGTIKFTDSMNWGTVYAYFYSTSSGTCGAEWPGSTMTWYETNPFGQGNYQITIPSGATHVVFNNGGSSQTVDLSVSGVEGYYLDGSQTEGKYNGTAWDSSAMEGGSTGGGSTGGGSTGGSTGGQIKFTDSLSWGTVYAYFYSTSSGTCGSEWPGSTMTWYENNFEGKGNYQISIPSGATHVVFNNGNGAQTVDLSLSGVEGYYLDGSQTEGKYNGTAWDASAMVSSSAMMPTDPVESSAASSDLVASGAENAAWPGVLMTLDSATGYYVIEVPEGMENALVIFTEGESSTNRYPADQQPGLALNGNTMLFSAGNSWEEYIPESTTEPTDPPTTPTEPPTTPTEPPTTPTEPPTTPTDPDQVVILIGDVSDDGEIDLRDALMVQKFKLSLDTLTDIEQEAADVDLDGEVTLQDAIAIHKYVLRLAVSSSIGQTKTITIA